MDRRSFLRTSTVGAASAAVLAVSGAALPSGLPGGRRVSNIPGDPGERLYAEMCGDGLVPQVFLDGVEQHMAVTADEAEGFVYRIVTTAKGNIAVNMSTNEILYETVRGVVRIVAA